MAGCGVTIETVDLDEPRHRPQSLQREDELVQQPASGAIHQNRGWGTGCARLPTARRDSGLSTDLAMSGTRSQIHAAATNVSSAQAGEQRAPVHVAQREFRGRGRRERACAASRHDPARQRRLLLRAAPRRRSPSAAPSGRRRPGADQRARRRRVQRGFRQREEERARSRPSTQQRGLDAARPMTIEQNARPAAGTAAKATK